MKTLDDLIKQFEKWQKDIDNQIMEAQENTAKQIWEDVISNCNFKNDTGQYISSIRIDGPTKEKNEIKTFIGSDMIVGPTKWTMGKSYNLGYLLEHGTFEHAIPNAFGKGFYYGFTDKKGVFHKGTLDRDWHPGSIATPHYSIALLKNKKLYKDNIKIAWRHE